MASFSSFTYLITGASRSLGLAYVRALLAARAGSKVVAAVRSPDKAEELTKVAKENEGRVYILKLDVLDEKSCKSAADELEKSGFLSGKGLDSLINVAGILGNIPPPSETTPSDVLETISTNLGGVMNVTQAFLPLLRQGEGKQIFTLSSTCGSIERWGGNTDYTAYAISKAALNMYLAKLSTELGQSDFTVVTVCPGYVKTDFNGHSGILTIEESVNPTLSNIFLKAGPKENGKFLSYDGTTIPW